MITNERQYKITRAAAERFEKALAGFDGEAADRTDVHPRILQAEKDALKSQLADLRAEIAAYEKLKSAELSMITIDSFDDLADGLIQARIAAGLSQRELAARLGLKEQQIQRYESERYASASLQRLRDIANAIGVRIRNDILVPRSPRSFDDLVHKLRQVGIEREFLFDRLLPSGLASQAAGETPSGGSEALASRTGAVLERVFGWAGDAVFGPEPLTAPRFAAAEARFKMPAGRTSKSTSLYAAYANYLATVVLRGSAALPKSPLPADPREVRRVIVDRYGALSLETALNVAWDFGVPVLPLRDSGTFHGACWRYEGRNVIVLKQRSKHASRWLFDLLHEWDHAASRPEIDTLEIVEADETSDERRNADEEVAASRFAGEVLLDGRAEELAQACVEEAGGSVERLKGAVERVADREGVDVGALANYMAFRLSWQGLSWWGAAANLQSDDEDPWSTARDVFIDRFPWTFEHSLDRELLNRALH